ncbi:MAG: pyrroline-5-carboxylate reductase [Helicobacteraceae bacterium]|jgi:pyrroline-5-carboxylate reductase|nr:pyrroline-5-carboxylate reductase [Helicobacteraceae bacterium]
MDILLIGAGAMGGALLKGWGSSHSVLVAEASADRRRTLENARFAADNSEAKGRIVVLAVKPQSLGSVKIPVRAKAIVSIMAGVTLETLRENFEADYFIRAMPNLAALHQRSATALTGDAGFKSEALELFNAVGKAVWFESEKELAIATALSGSGPGYLALIAEALANGAVRLGMKSDDAYALTQALFEGMPSLLAGEHPAALKDRVCSPNGTTIEGIAALERSGVRGAIIDAVKAAFDQSERLAKKRD